MTTDNSREPRPANPSNHPTIREQLAVASQQLEEERRLEAREKEDLNGLQTALAEQAHQRTQLSRQLAHVRKELHYIRGKVATMAAAFPFVVEQQVASDANCDGITPSNYPGLCYVQVIHANGMGKLLSVWEREEAFQSHGDALAAAFGIAQPNRTPEFSGPQRAALFAQLPRLRQFWDFVTRNGALPLALLAGFAAALSHFDTIVDSFYQYRVTAPVTITGSKTTLPVLVGQQFSTEFEVQNESSFASSFVQVTKGGTVNHKTNQADQGIILDGFQARTFPLIKPADAKTLKVTGRAVRPGVYTLTIEGYYASPVWRSDPSKRVTTKETRQIEVWEAASIELSSKLPNHVLQRGNSACNVNLRIRSGQAFSEGLSFRATLLKVPGVEFEGVSLQGVFQWPDPLLTTMAGKEAASITWRSKRLESFDVLDGHVKLKTVDGTTRTPAQWSQIASSVTFEVLKE